MLAACTDSPVPAGRANDQTQPAGVLRGDTLQVDLTARMAKWHPASDSGPSLEAALFAAGSEAPSAPGPLIRVPVGTIVSLSVSNVLDDTLFVSGLRSPTTWDSLVVPPGARVTSVFPTPRAGIFVYQGGTRRNAQVWPRGPGEQLSGVIVVDSAGAQPDRILVIGSWNGAPIAPLPDSTFVMLINGKTWPHTERIHTRMGDTVRWKVVSVSPANHPMHLHGGYFRVEAAGPWRGDRPLEPQFGTTAATETLFGQESRTISWTPTRPGRWLFHCHDAFHIQASQHDDLARRPRDSHDVHSNAAEHLARGMAGLILGIEVEGDTVPGSDSPRRALDVTIVSREKFYGTSSAIGFAGPGDSLQVPGPPLILTRDEPVAITVRNRSGEPASVHWHGIELESFYDGVAGWSGAGPLRAPLIAPGDSFIVRFTPPRAGTFIYHSHVAELRHIASGMYGALIVLEPRARWNPARDHLLIFSQWGMESATDSGLIVVNGRREPALEPLAAGVPHRLRFINIAAGDVVEATLSQDDSVLVARALAKDGAELPAGQSRRIPARMELGSGETLDLEVIPRRGTIRLAVKSFNNLVTIPVK